MRDGARRRGRSQGDSFRPDLLTGDRVNVGADVNPMTEQFLDLTGEGEQVETPVARVALDEEIDVAADRRVAARHRTNDPDV